MIVSLFNRKYKLNTYLNHFKQHAVSIIQQDELKEKISRIKIETNHSIEQLADSLLFTYNIFPDNILIFAFQGQENKGRIALNDTICQQAFLPPLPFFSLKLIFGVRVTEIIKKENRKGFSYTTLEGHPEKGISTFTFETTQDGTYFVIHTYSKPGNFWSKLAGAWFTDPYQNYCTRKALKAVKNQAEQGN